MLTAMDDAPRSFGRLPVVAFAASAALHAAALLAPWPGSRDDPTGARPLAAMMVTVNAPPLRAAARQSAADIPRPMASRVAQTATLQNAVRVTPISEPRAQAARSEDFPAIKRLPEKSIRTLAQSLAPVTKPDKVPRSPPIPALVARRVDVRPTTMTMQSARDLSTPAGIKRPVRTAPGTQTELSATASPPGSAARPGTAQANAKPRALPGKSSPRSENRIRPLAGNPRPAYPRFARIRGLQGRVILEVRVNAQGRVADISVNRSSGHRVLDKAAVRTVRRWRFAAPKLADKRGQASVLVPISFRLTG